MSRIYWLRRLPINGPISQRTRIENVITAFHIGAGLHTGERTLCAHFTPENNNIWCDCLDIKEEMGLGAEPCSTEIPCPVRSYYKNLPLEVVAT
jgi:hypothetical protein